jgi:hypothetical protein
LRVALAGLFIMIVVWLQAASEETRVYNSGLHAQGQFTIYNNFVREELIEAGLLPDGFSADLQCKGEVWAQVFALLVGKVVGVLLLQSSFADNPMAILSRQQQTVKRFWFGSQGGQTSDIAFCDVVAACQIEPQTARPLILDQPRAGLF